MNLKTTFIKRRSRELALSDRLVARSIGLNTTRLKALLDGYHHDTLTLRHLQSLADTLACDVTDLLDTDEPTGTINESDADRLPATVAALLATANTGVHITTLAEATASELPAVESAVDVLDQHLQACGLTVRRNTNDGSITIAAAATPNERQVQVVLRGASTRRQLDLGSARIVHRILSEGATLREVGTSNNGRVRLGQLINADLVLEPASASAPLEVSADVRESLLLDER